MSTSTPLFQKEVLTINQMVARIESTLRKKAVKYDLSFGIFKAKGGPETMNCFVGYVNDKGDYTQKTIQADSFSDMMQQALEFIDQLNQPKTT